MLTSFYFKKGSVWVKIVSFSLLLFFIQLSDAVLSYWIPGLVENRQNSSFYMGLIISFSSVVGLFADLVFPQILKQFNVKKMLFLAFIASFLFILILLFYVITPLVLIILLGMAVWGIYYELLGFSNKQFVASGVPLESRSSAWGIMGIFKTLAYFFGPLLAAFLISKGDLYVLLAAALFTTIASIIYFLHKHHDHVQHVEIENINILKELQHCFVLLKHVWPVVIVSIMLGLIDATFWTIGAVLSSKLASQQWYGGWFLPMYTLPSIFAGLLVTRWGIYKGKKKASEIFLMIGGLILTLLYFDTSVALLLLIVFAAGFAFAVSYPLTDAVFSDIVSRMGKERKQMIGLSNSTMSLAYIIGPVLAGALTLLGGERMVFVIIGSFAAVSALILLFVTPRKLLLPQHEIQSWD